MAQLAQLIAARLGLGDVLMVALIVAILVIGVAVAIRISRRP